MKTKLTNEEKRVKIAEACGKEPWLKCHNHSEVTLAHAKKGSGNHLYCPWCGDDLAWEELPNYFECLNAISEAVSPYLADQSFWKDWTDHLKSFDPECDGWNTTAAQRAEAFGLTLKLWEAGE